MMADADDFALVNACLRAEGELRERGYAALARFGIVAPGYRGDARSIPALPDAVVPEVLSAIQDLGWIYAIPEEERT